METISLHCVTFDDESTVASASFLRRYAGAKALLVTDGDDIRTIDDRMMELSATRLLWPR
jgi:hypothetical protein